MKLYSEDVFIILLLLSFIAFLVGYLELFGGMFAVVLVITTFLKGALISEHFMELKEVAYIYRLIPMIWLIVVLSLISVAYVLPLQ